jgi:hypothetical protein
MWQFLTLPGGGAGFDEWVEGEPALVHAGLGDEYPPGLESFLASRGVAEREFRLVLGCTTEVLYGNLYGAADEPGSWQHFCQLWDLAAPLGVSFPDTRPFGESLWSDGHGWGPRLTTEVCTAWRKGADADS